MINGMISHLKLYNMPLNEVICQEMYLLESQFAKFVISLKVFAICIICSRWTRQLFYRWGRDVGGHAGRTNHPGSYRELMILLCEPSRIPHPIQYKFCCYVIIRPSSLNSADVQTTADVQPTADVQTTVK